MIVNLPDATTNDINKKIISLREEGGAVTMGRVLTLVIAPDSEDILEDSVEAANFASREHPCRVIAVLPGDRKAAEPRLDAEIRVGADAGAGEVVVLRLAGELADHASSVVLPFLLPDTPVVAWWPAGAPPESRTGSAGPVGDSPHHRRDQQQRPLGGDQEQAEGLHRGRHRSGVEPDHILARAAGVGAGPGAVRADQLGAGVGSEDRTRARHPRRLAGQPDRRHRCSGRSAI